ncbi:MAG: endonuclease/exonuclease/phosphatase family protein [Pseudomonadota bacterium]
MAVRIATFNAENLMQRFDFSGWRNDLRRDRALQMFDIRDKEHFEELEQARVVAHTDDAMQLTALAIAQTRADIICLQEVENLEALKAFEYGYLFKMIGQGYRHKYLVDGNDGRGIDVAVMMRDETSTGEPIEFVSMKSHAHVTFADFGLHNKGLKERNLEATERVFKRDCLEIDVKVGGRLLTLFVVHFKSMSGGRDGMDGRSWTMPVRKAESRAVRQIIEKKFGKGKTEGKRWIVCGDLNDYRSRIVVSGTPYDGYSFETVAEKVSGIDPLLSDGFSFNLCERMQELERWTLYHSRGPDERHLCQLDYLLVSPHLAEKNPETIPEIIHAGQPWRTPFPPDQNVDRYPRTGWDRPKASDHSPVVAEISLL